MFKNLSIILIASLLALVSFEMFLKYSPFEYGVSPINYDKTVGVWHKKNFSDTWIKECYRTPYSFDEKGFIKTQTKYDDNKKDVVILGDSFIEALMVKNENIIHNSLAKEFSNRYNFINLGLSDSSPTQQFVILKDKANLENTKYVIQFINLENDLLDVDSANANSMSRPRVYVEFNNSIDNFKIIPPREQTMYDKVADILGEYQIYVYIKKLMYYAKSKITGEKTIQTSVDENQKQDLTKNWLYLDGALHQINNMLKEKNIEYKVIVISEVQKYKDNIKKFLQKENIEFIFLNDKAKEMKIKLQTFKCDGHWNDEAHQNVAKIIKTSKLIN